jgi:DNA adenine methylase
MVVFNLEQQIPAYPFVKWAGGKRQLLKVFEQYFPARDSYCSYHEPFLGGGAVFFDIQPPKAVLMDINPELINTYQVIQNDLEGLIRELKAHKKKHCENYYYEVREWDRLPGYKELAPEKKAARFIYLNRTCYNGLYRVNSKGHYNVPIGSYKNPRILDEKNLINIHRLLDGDREIIVKKSDYKLVLEYAKERDFVYFDPPYYPLDETSFTSYTKDDFGYEEHEELAEVYQLLHERGCKVALSNSNVEEVQLLYQYPEFKKIEVDANRNINSNAEGRGPIKELLIINY